MLAFLEKKLYSAEQAGPMDQLAKSLDNLCKAIYPCMGKVPDSCMPDMASSVSMSKNTVYRVNTAGYFYNYGKNVSSVADSGVMVSLSDDHETLDALATLYPYCCAIMHGSIVNKCSTGGLHATYAKDAGKWKREFIMGFYYNGSGNYGGSVSPNYASIDENKAKTSTAALALNQNWCTNGSDSYIDKPVITDLRKTPDGRVSGQASYLTTSNVSGSGHGNNMIPIIPGVGNHRDSGIVSDLSISNVPFSYDSVCKIYQMDPLTSGSMGTYIALTTIGSGVSTYFIPTLLPKVKFTGDSTNENGRKGIVGTVKPITKIRSTFTDISFNKVSEMVKLPAELLTLKDVYTGEDTLKHIWFSMYDTKANDSDVRVHPRESPIQGKFINSFRRQRLAIQGTSSIGHFRPFQVILHKQLLNLTGSGIINYKDDTKTWYIKNMNVLIAMYKGNYVLVPTEDGENTSL